MNARFIAVLVVIAVVHLVVGGLLLGFHGCRKSAGPAPADRGEDYRVADTSTPGGGVDADTPEVAPDPPADTAAEPVTHVVRSGESYWALSRKYGVTMKALREANGHSPDHVLQVGEKLKIPPRGG